MCEVRDLKPNGANILVTEENKKEYVHLVCQMKMTGEIEMRFLFFGQSRAINHMLRAQNLKENARWQHSPQHQS